MGNGCFAFFGYNHENNTVLSHKNKQTRFNTNCRTCFFLWMSFKFISYLGNSFG